MCAARGSTSLGCHRAAHPHPHDIWTVNEVLCRGTTGRVLRRCRVHVWEPGPHNLEILHVNAASFGERRVVHEAAIGPVTGPAPPHRSSGSLQRPYQSERYLLAKSNVVRERIGAVSGRDAAVLPHPFAVDTTGDIESVA